MEKLFAAINAEEARAPRRRRRPISRARFLTSARDSAREKPSFTKWRAERTFTRIPGIAHAPRAAMQPRRRAAWWTRGVSPPAPPMLRTERIARPPQHGRRLPRCALVLPLAYEQRRECNSKSAGWRSLSLACWRYQGFRGRDRPMPRLAQSAGRLMREAGQ